MLLEQRTVSRKTPRDGRLEITPESAARLAALGAEFALTASGETGRGRLEAMPCGCAKGGTSGGHVHHFVESPLLARLAPETTVLIELDETTGTVQVEGGR